MDTGTCDASSKSIPFESRPEEVASTVMEDHAVFRAPRPSSVNCGSSGNINRERKPSPAYIVYVKQCRQRNKVLHSASLLMEANSPIMESSDDMMEDDEVEATNSMFSSLGGNVESTSIEALAHLSLTSSHLSHDACHSRTLSASSKTSLDSLRTAQSSGQRTSRASTPCEGPLSSSAPLSTLEVYELSRYVASNVSGSDKVLRNPNKAMLTVAVQTSTIVMCNSVTSTIFGYTPEELIGRPLADLFSPENYLQELTLTSDYCGQDGQNISVSEKLVVGVDKTGSSFPLSLWIKPVLSSQATNRCLAIVEPVERTTGVLTTNLKGEIVDADPQLAPVLGFHENPGELLDWPITSLMPKLCLPTQRSGSMPEDLRVQHVTGHAKNGQVLSLTVLLRFGKEKEKATFQGASFPSEHSAYDFEADLHFLVILYHNVTGLLTASLDGVIQSCDPCFSTMIFGYGPEEINGKHVESIIPGLLEDVKSLRVNLLISPLFLALSSRQSRQSGNSLSSMSRASGSTAMTSCPSSPSNAQSANELDVILETDNDSCCSNDSLVGIGNNLKRNIQTSSRGSEHQVFEPEQEQKQRDEVLESQQQSVDKADSRAQGDAAISRGAAGSNGSKRSRHMRSGCAREAKPLLLSEDLTSDSPDDRQPKLLNDNDGFGDDKLTGAALVTLKTVANHKDDFAVNVIVQAKCVAFDANTSLICMWVKRQFDSEVFDSASSSPAVHQTQHSSKQDVPLSTEAFMGPYSDRYLTLKTIGKGAFGEVKLAVDRSTAEQVIVKCIGKKEVLSCSWTDVSEEEYDRLSIVSKPTLLGRDTTRVPTELYLLRTLAHPNIVSLVTVFETDFFYQLVMPKHGEGMDLFEFIDLEPAVDELLAFYLFSQVADAVEYLHGQNVIHRDIKDENIILNHLFEVQLIDFGSAAYVTEGELFSTFCGTIDYCSPEVLTGSRYQGPELEMWTLGITLYTLIFFENPFNDADDIVTGSLEPPFSVSASLLQVILWLLHPDPTSRCTMKQLRTCGWMNQEVDISQYDFELVLNPATSKVQDDLPQKLGKPRILSGDIQRPVCKSH